MKIKQMLPFLILMQNVKHKSPSYIEKCYRQCSASENPYHVLDQDNLAILLGYINKWGSTSNIYTGQEIMAMQKRYLEIQIKLAPIESSKEKEKIHGYIVDEDDGYPD